MELMNIFAGSNLSAIFVGSGEQDVIALSKIYLVINGSCYWVLGLLFIYRFTLQGLGNGWVPTVAGIMELIMRATAAIILVERLGFTGASSASPLAWIGACIPLGLAYHITIQKMVPKQTETAPVKIGCLAAEGIDYISLGKDTGKMAAKILKGEAKAEDMEYQLLTESNLYVNEKVAENLGVTVPDSMNDRAVETFSEISEG